MQWRDNPQRYGLLSMLLHWSIAVLVLALLLLGVWFAGLGNFDGNKQLARSWHQGLGLLVAVLMLVRMFWRWRSVNPQQGPRSALERQVLRKVRLFMYLLVFVACISGYLLASSGSRELDWFGLFQVAQLTRLDMAQLAQVRSLHTIAVWSLATLVALHVLATLKYQLLQKEPILQRMLGRR